MKTGTKNLPAVSSLSLEQKIGQMIMVDFSGYAVEGEILDQLRAAPWGGVILFQKNIRNREQLMSLNAQLSELDARIPMYISLDQEGGLVNRADFSDMHLSPGNKALGRIDNTAVTEEVACISGVELRELGFHLNFAPVVDVNINPGNPIIGVRAFGDEPELVARHGVAMVKGFEKAGIASCAKHFPGHGDTSFDSHLCLASVEAGDERIWRVELPPFKAAIDAGVPVIMTAHVIFPAVDESKLPATLSKKILTDLLREQMNFEGIIVTDSMGMKAIADHFGTGEAAVMTVEAGADIVMMCGTRESQMMAYEAILEAVKSGRISVERIDQSLERIFRFKDRYVTGVEEIPAISQEEREEIIRRAVRKSVTVMYDNSGMIPVKDTDKRTLVFSPNHLYKTLLDEYTDEWSLYPHIESDFSRIQQVVYDIDNPDLEFFLKETPVDAELVFFELYSRGILTGKMHEIASSYAKLARNKGIRVVYIVLSSAYGVPMDADAAVTAYSFLSPSLEAISRVLLEA